MAERGNQQRFDVHRPRETDEELLAYIRKGNLELLGRPSVRIIETLVRKLDALQEQVNLLRAAAALPTEREGS